MRTVALRGLLARKTRLILTSLAIALGVTLIAGTYIFTDTINASFDRIFLESNKGADVAVTPNDTFGTDDHFVKPMPASVLAQVRRSPSVLQAQGSVFDQGGTILGSDGKRVGAGGSPNFIGSAGTVERFEAFQVASGRLPRSADEVALDKATADKEGLRVGGRLRVQGQKAVKAYAIVGVTRIAGVDSFGGAAVALLTLAEAQRVSGKEGAYDQIQAQGRPGTKPQALRAELRAALPKDVQVRTGTEQAAARSRDTREQLGPLQTALLAFAGISLFVGAFIIFNTFSITVAQRSREFALLRMLGAGRRQIMTSVLTEGAILGVAGSVIGLALGVGVASGLRALFRVVGFELPSNGTVLATRTVVVSLLVGTVVTLIASAAPALRATRVPPVAALRDDGVQPMGRRSRLALPLALLLSTGGVAAMAIGLFASLSSSSALTFVGIGAGAMFIGVALLSPRLVRPIAAAIGGPLARVAGLTGRLARENTVRQPGRTAVTAAALMIGVALVAFASILAAGAKTTVSGYIDQGLEGQAVIQNTDGFSSFAHEATRTVARTPGVATVAGLRFVEVRIGAKKTRITGVDPSFPDVYRIDRAVGRLDTGTAALRKKYADKHGLKVGDTLKLSARTGTQVPLRVAAVVQDDAQLTNDVIVANRLLERELGLTKDSLVVVGFQNGADPKATLAAISARLERDFPQVEALSKDAFKKDFADQINKTLVLIYALLVLTIIVSLFGIVNTLVLSITERTRELGMLRAVGMSRRQVRRMIRYEAVITSLIGAVLGLVLGVVLSVLVTRPLDNFDVSFPAGTLAGLLVLGAVAGVLAAILPARRASRLDPLRALAYE